VFTLRQSRFLLGYLTPVSCCVGLIVIFEVTDCKRTSDVSHIVKFDCREGT
jgi:hypothetical protein